METLKYSLLKDTGQYKEYCGILEELIFSCDESAKDEIELLLH